MMFDLRHIQLIVTLTSKDEKSREKFHGQQHLFRKVWQRPGPKVLETGQILPILRKNGGCKGGPIWY
jgi:hypothetical protein